MDFMGFRFTIRKTYISKAHIVELGARLSFQDCYESWQLLKIYFHNSLGQNVSCWFVGPEPNRNPIKCILLLWKMRIHSQMWFPGISHSEKQKLMQKTLGDWKPLAFCSLAEIIRFLIKSHCVWLMLMS